ncbi:hypothetical protein BCR44DRAFT_344500 [Catenaria anguillulae PL171]|uniref:Uncharacterized protein n=1 Tax=Catenaria anguillulae PL171 TaxID=765915 RepID=A0A1Y2HCM9_9FUNG|nr:hypothetical protein BCR44DRAFT_344500 [Catenaria anguillulae PL171]
MSQAGDNTETDAARPAPPLTRTVQWLCMSAVIASFLIILATVPCLIAQWHSSPYGSMRARFYLLMFVFAMVIADTLNNFSLSLAMLLDMPVSMRNYYLARVATYVPIDGPLMLALLHRTVGLLLGHKPALRRGILLGGAVGAVMLTTMSATAIISETIRTYRTEQEQGSDEPWTQFAVPSYGILALLPYPFVVIYASWWSLAVAFPREKVARRRRMNLGLAGLADGKLSSHHHQYDCGRPHDSYAMTSFPSSPPPPPPPAALDQHSPLPISPPPQYHFTAPPSPGSFHTSPELPKRPLSASLATRRPELRVSIPPPLPRPHLGPGVLTPDSPQPSPITPCTPMRESRPLVTFAPSPTQSSPSTFTPPRPLSSAGVFINPSPSPRACTGPSVHTSFHFPLHSVANATNKRASAATSLFSLAPAPAIKRPLVRTFQWLTVLVVLLWILGGSVLLIDRSVLHPRLRSILASTVSAASVLLEAAFVRVFKVQCRLAMQPATPGLRARIVKWFQGSSGENRDESGGESAEPWSSYYVGGGSSAAGGVVSGTQNAPVYWIDHEDLAKMHAARVALAARAGPGAPAAAAPGLAPGAQTFSQLWRAQANTWRGQMCRQESRQDSCG